MKKVYCQPYSKNRFINCYYGKPSKGHFRWDIIRLEIPGENLWMTPDEAASIIRALSAGLHHFLVNGKQMKQILKAKKEVK